MSDTQTEAEQRLLMEEATLIKKLDKFELMTVLKRIGGIHRYKIYNIYNHILYWTNSFKFINRNVLIRCVKDKQTKQKKKATKKRAPSIYLGYQETLSNFYTELLLSAEKAKAEGFDLNKLNMDLDFDQGKETLNQESFLKVQNYFKQRTHFGRQQSLINHYQ